MFSLAFLPERSLYLKSDAEACVSAFVKLKIKTPKRVTDLHGPITLAPTVSQ